MVAIASAKDADEMAKTLDSIADPPGGWRLKRRKSRRTLSISAHAGFYGGMELRWGSYGAIQEAGQPGGGCGWQESRVDTLNDKKRTAGCGLVAGFEYSRCYINNKVA